MHATISRFDPATRCGAVLLDDGVELPFDDAAFAAGGLRTVRFGQRVRLELAEPADSAELSAGETGGEASAAPVIRGVWLVTVHPLA